jgi:predicted Rossmann fold nucleotide-binding protein DprA/Smf involved in DNA uptake
VPALAEALGRTATRAHLRLPSAPASIRIPVPKPLAALLARIGPDPVHPDRLATALGMTAADLSTRLADLELGGHVRTLPGGLVARSAPAAHTAANPGG